LAAPLLLGQTPKREEFAGIRDRVAAKGAGHIASGWWWADPDSSPAFIYYGVREGDRGLATKA
jgi:hypothetical protein